MADANLSAFTVQGNTGAQKFSLKADIKAFAILAVFFFGLVAIQVVMSLSPAFVFIGFALIPAWIFYRLWRFNKAQKSILSHLAADNGWSLDQPMPDAAYTAGPTINLILDPTGVKLAGELNGLPFWLCATSQATFILIDAKRSLPRSIFVSSVYDSGPVRLIFSHFLKAEKLAPVKMEGDFDKYFRLYIEPAATTDTLSIVAPDFMASLIEAGHVSSIMFADRFCFIKAYGVNQKDLKALLVSGQALAKQLSDH